MPRDARGLPVSGASSEVIDAIDRFTVNLLDARDSAGAILDLAERHHDCALVQWGGSDAQNNRLAQTYLVSLIETDPRAAAPLLARRIGMRPPTPLEEHWLAQL